MSLTDDELRALISRGESDRVEFKAEFTGSAKDKVREAICAFANDLPNHQLPGYVIIGVRDDGTVAGLPISDLLLQQLSGIKNEGQLVPPPSISVAKRSLDGNDVAIVEVHPHGTPPVTYKGAIHVRNGPRRDIATLSEERILNEKRRFKDQTFDIHPFMSASLADLNLYKFDMVYLPAAVSPDVLEANNRTVEQRLAAQKMVMTADQPVPTVLGMLVLGRKVTDLIPGAYVNFLRVDGTDLADPVTDNLRVDGTVDDVIRRTEEKLEAHNRTAVEFRGRPLEVRRSTYPMEAMRQILRNAILHRTYEGTNAPVKVTWYNDRIEFHNPGGPYGQVRVEEFGQSLANDYRNPNLAEAMRNLELVQKFGAGILIARRELAANGNPPPEFTATQAWCKVVLRPAHAPNAE